MTRCTRAIQAALGPWLITAAIAAILGTGAVRSAHDALAHGDHAAARPAAAHAHPHTHHHADHPGHAPAEAPDDGPDHTDCRVVHLLAWGSFAVPVPAAEVAEAPRRIASLRCPAAPADDDTALRLPPGRAPPISPAPRA